MIEKKQQEFILRGKLKKAILSRTSVTQNEYYLSPLQVEETEKDGQKVENEVDSIMLIFWKDNFPPETQKTIADLKENQTILVRGYYQGVDNGLWHVTELLEVEKDDENDLYI
jgi:hypothetical protein